jgi:hypothetical protein
MSVNKLATMPREAMILVNESKSGRLIASEAAVAI